MNANEIRAYEGKEPFIFISYAHKDTDRVLPILAKLQTEGYRVWYDEGIAPGSEWPENIAQHLNDCAVVIAMISANSMASANCRREITYALAKKKPFLGIFLEETAMSPGMELQLSAQQCLMKFSYRNEALFYDKVSSCPDLAPCLQKPQPLPAESAPAPAPAPVPEKPAPAPKAATKPGKKLWIPIAAAAAVVVLVVAIVLAAGGGNGTTPTDPQMNSGTSDPTTEPSSSTKPTEPSSSTKPTEPSSSTKPTEPSISNTVTILPGYEVELDAYSVSILGETITADAITQINKLLNVKSLYFYNCTFEPGILDELNVSELNMLLLDHAQGIEDFHFLTKLPKLMQLYLPGSGVTDSNFPRLECKTLFRVDLTDNTEFSDLTLVTSLPGLTHLYCGNTAVTSLAPLAPLEALTSIDFSGCALEAITDPFYSFYLEELRLAGCSLADISGLHHLTVLTLADLSGNQLEDVSFLEKSAASLKTVTLSYNPLEAEDLQFLSKCKSVTELRVSGIALGDLSICNNMSKLQTLEASHCQLTSTSGLSVLMSLKYLQLSHNLLTEFGLGHSSFDNYPILDLSFNDLKEFSSVMVEYNLLCLVGNENLVFNNTLALNGSTLLVSYHESILTGSLNFSSYYVLDCPMDQVVKVNDRFGKSSVTLLKSEEELLTVLREKGLNYP